MIYKHNRIKLITKQPKIRIPEMLYFVSENIKLFVKGLEI